MLNKSLERTRSGHVNNVQTSKQSELGAGETLPMIKAQANTKVSVSSSNIEESLNGVVGNKIQSRQTGNRKQVTNPSAGRMN